MATKIEEDAIALLKILYDGENKSYNGKELASIMDIHATEINDAVEYLDDRGLIDRQNALGTYPFHFDEIIINSRGKYLYQQIQSEINKSDSNTLKTSESNVAVISNMPPVPIGSPYGFTDLDWEYVQKRKKQPNYLNVVFGFQFKSDHYDTEQIKLNIKKTFDKAIDTFNKRGGRDPISLEFKPLAAGYGEHLFNQIARDIISSDIAVFETSDLNPNVMIEMGVALTWGCRVLPIKKQNCPKPPSDISGQTWADYNNNGLEFLNDNHEEDLLLMIERSIQRKTI